MLFNLFGKKKETPDPEKSSPQKSSKYRELTVRSIVKETAEAISITFETPAEGLPYEAGQFLTLILIIEGDEVRRSYSLCTSPTVDPHPAVTVKRVASGKVSNYLNDTLKPGDTIRVAEPAGTFTTAVDAANQRHVVMFGGGSGITPLMGLLKSVLHTESQSKVSLIYANRSADSIIFSKQLASLRQQYSDRFHVVHVLEDATDHSDAHEGQVLAERVPELLEALPFSEATTEYFLCGPQGMMENVRQALQSLDVPSHLVHKESFVLSKSATAKTDAASEKPTATWDTDTTPGAYRTTKAPVNEAHEVTIRYEGETHRFVVEPESTILQTALALDIELPYSCQSGLCTACMGKCVSGRMKLDEEDSLTDDDLKQGYVLTCVGHPLTDNVVIEIE
ncbi:MAG: ferredoxin--NADP reductase [Tunicatimonas sp.]